MSAFILPDLGEGLKDADLVEWLVKEGQSVKLDELVLLVETAKAVVELPAPSSCVITRLAVSEGDTVKVGQVLFEYEEKQDSDPHPRKPAKNINAKNLQTKKESVSVVGELDKADTETANLYEMAELPETVENKSTTNASLTTKSDPVCLNAFKESRIQRKTTTTPATFPSSSAISPKVMAFAKKLGLQDILADTFYGDMSLNDLLTIYQERISKQENAPVTPQNSIALSGARKVMAKVMMKSHQEVPSATLFDDADITHWSSKKEITLNVIKAIVIACAESPFMNAWYDAETMSVQQHKHIDLGLAVNTERGLFVPVLRNIGTKKDPEIKTDVEQFRHQIAQQTIQAKDLVGATISLSNFGVLSGRYATPIIVPPQVCIIGIGKAREEPIVKNGVIQTGKVLPISISFDHRVATGAEAALFMQSLISTLES